MAKKGTDKSRARERYKSEHHFEQNKLLKLKRYQRNNPNDQLVGTKIEEVQKKLDTYALQTTPSTGFKRR